MSNWYFAVKESARYQIPVHRQNANGYRELIYPSERQPLKDTDVVVVYHGINSMTDVMQILTKGVSGKDRVGRRYSYESDNNPRGLFVTLDFRKAKEFASGFWPAVIVEFAARVSDLESPVWPGGGYTVQGEMAQFFYGDEEKREQARLKARQNAVERAHKDNDKAIYESDRPELAQSLLWGGENQALFSGDLNPNMIRAVWVSQSMDSKYGKTTDTTKPWSRMNRGQFLRMMQKEIKPEDYEKGEASVRNVKYRETKPADTFDANTLFRTLARRLDRAKGEPTEDRIQEIIGIFGDMWKRGDSDYEFLHYVWPKQLPGFKDFMRQKFGPGGNDPKPQAPL